MKTLQVALIVPTLLLSAVAFAEDPAKGSVRDVPDFDGVQVSNGLSAKVTVGPKSVRITGDEKQVSQVRTEVVDGKLVVKMEKKGWFGSNSGKGVQITISSPKVTSVEASGGADVEAEVSASESFVAEASGGGDVSVSNLDVKKLKVDVSGGAEATVKGRAELADMEASGGAEIHARDLSLKTLKVDASGGCSVEANPTDSISADVSGGSSVHVDSAPTQREVSSSGGAKVVFSKK
ncbi:MAG TPA: head GIN domain-containing protein [Hyalangium sp.]|nr:head GIN domain-containing protein [Hyalangium sp.]